MLVIFGGMIGYSGDDINKFLWMVRIAEGEHPQDIKVGGASCYWLLQNNMLFHYRFQESNYFTPQGEFRVDSAGSETLLNCLMYKLAYYRFGEVQTYNGPSGITL